MNKIKIACFLTLALLIAGFAAAKGTKSQASLPNIMAEPIIIKAIEHSQSEGSTELVIRANIPFEYTSYDPDPGMLVIEIPEGNLDSIQPTMNLETGQVKDVTVKKIPGRVGDFFIGRIEITYNPGIQHSLSMEGSELHVRMGAPQAAAEAPVTSSERAQVGYEQPIQQTDTVRAGEGAVSPESSPPVERTEVNTPPASRIHKISINDGNDSLTEVIIEGDGQLAYNSFKIDKPERVVLDIQNVAMMLPGKQFAVKGPFVEKVRASQFKAAPEQVARIVFDMKKDSPFNISRTGNLLKVKFSEAPEPAASAAAQETAALTQEKRESSTGGSPVPVAAAEAAPVMKTNEAERISSPAAALSEESPEKPAPVQAIASEPPLVPESRVNADQNTPQYSKQEIDAGVNEKAKEDYVIFRDEPEKLAAASEEEEKKLAPQFQAIQVTPEEVQYTGKKISLNLVDADIKQVFRLFHEISGLNFVLDPGVSGKVTIVLDNVPWDQALDIILKNNGLDKIYEENVIRIASTTKLAQEAASRKQLKDAKELEADPMTITRTLSYAKSVEVEKVIRQSGMISPRGRVIMDERTNSLIVTDVPTRIPPIDNLITSIDSQTPQVMIEARIVETSREFVQDFGVKWGFTGIADAAHGTQTNLQFPHTAKIDYALNLPFTAANAVSPDLFSVQFGNVLNSFNLDIAIEALETDGKARVLSAPKIATQNNEKAEIERGVRIPVVNTTATEINVEFVSASLRLQVTPQITAEGTIVLDITVENNNPDFVNRVGDVPPINTERAQTKVLINDGGTTVIGGIFSQSEGISEAGVPWFRKIPLFGWLFKRRNVTNEDRELLIFLTARIMKSSA